MSEDPKGKVGEYRLFKAKAHFRILVLLIMELYDGESLLAWAKPFIPLLKTRKIIVPTS